ncbi:putative Subtilisin-like protease 2 [Ilyonectria robusta]
MFPKEGTDISATANFIKSTVENHDLHPRADVGEQLISWTVEASPSEVTKLEDYGGIARIVKFEIPSHQEKQRRRKSTVIEGIYKIYPVDRDNQDQCKAISASLEVLLSDKVRERHWNDRIESWTVELTDDQIPGCRGPYRSLPSGIPAIDTVLYAMGCLPIRRYKPQIHPTSYA